MTVLMHQMTLVLVMLHLWLPTASVVNVAALITTDQPINCVHSKQVVGNSASDCNDIGDSTSDSGDVVGDSPSFVVHMWT